MVFLCRGLVVGNMSTVVPLVAVVGTALPVLLGVALLGDRPSAPSWLGIVAVAAGIWPVVAGRAAAAVTILPFAVGARRAMTVTTTTVACLVGGLAALALG